MIFSYVCTSLLFFHQIIDWFWLEETLKFIQFLSPVTSRDIFHWKVEGTFQNVPVQSDVQSMF